MSGSIKNIIKKSLNPFIGVGAVCMLCSGIWLIAAGYWYALWPASMAFIFSAFIFPMLIFPASFFAENYRRYCGYAHWPASIGDADSESEGRG